jgi:hypothetical protein
MRKLKIIRAIYFDPNLGPDKGTDVTRHLSAQIRNDILLYNGKYNDIFPDEFKRIDKRLFVNFEYDNEVYEHLYAEDEKIYLPFDQGISTQTPTSIGGDYVGGDKITQTGYKPKLKINHGTSQGYTAQIIIGVVIAIIAGFILWYFGLN